MLPIGKIRSVPLFTAIDFEGTSREGSARATEVAVVSLDQKLQIGDSFETVLNPPVEPMKQSLSYARLSKEQIQAAPTFGSMYDHLIPFLNGRILIAHNKVYEIGVLTRELNDLEITLEPPFVCTLEWSRQILRHRLSNFTLSEVCGYFDVDLLNPHEAMADATATARVFANLYEQSENLRAHCDELLKQVVDFEPTGILGEPRVRDRFTAVNLERDELLELAHEILNNSRVMRSKFVVVTGTVLMGESRLESALGRAGFHLRETPTTAGTAFVIQAHAGGLSKIRKAHQYGRPVVSEADAFKLLDLISQIVSGR